MVQMVLYSRKRLPVSIQTFVKWIFWISLNGFCTHQALAFQHEILIGYGSGKEVEQSHHNQGLVVSAKLHRFYPIDDTLLPSLDGTLANLYADTKKHKHLLVAACTYALRAFFFKPNEHTLRPYVQASLGPALLSAHTLGNRTQGSLIAVQTTLETGIEIGRGAPNLDVNLRLIHYCNIGLFHPNQGINLLPIISIGYQF